MARKNEVAILFDSSHCTGCKGCQVACKEWNVLPSPLGLNANKFTGSYQSPANLNGDTRLVMTFDEKESGNGLSQLTLQSAVALATTARMRLAWKYVLQERSTIRKMALSHSTRISAMAVPIVSQPARLMCRASVPRMDVLISARCASIDLRKAEFRPASRHVNPRR